MSEYQREHIEKRHEDMQSLCDEYGLMPERMHTERGLLLQWLRKRDETIASLQKELARFQRADVGERVRRIATRHVGTPRSPLFKEDELTVAETRYDDRGELLAICRQQAAEIADLKRLLVEAVDERKRILAEYETAADQKLNEQAAEIERLKERLTDKQGELVASRTLMFEGWQRTKRRATAWKRCAKKWRHDHKIDTAQLNRDIAELQNELHAALEDATEQQNRRHEAEQRIRAYEDAPTDKHERLDEGKHA